jgi:tetratricopeptide (TPR) repeat protein
MIKNKIIVIIISILMSLVPFSLNGQDDCLRFADKFFDNGNYDYAITEYKRYLFFNPDSKLCGDVHYKIGLAFRHQNKWSKAISEMRKSVSFVSNDSIKDERRISIAIINIAKSNYSSAEFELIRIVHFSKYPILKRKAHFFLGVCYLYTSEWEKARKEFNDFYLSNFPDKIDSLFNTASTLEYKSPVLAKWLSTFIPGSGQIYGGDIKNGINAFLLNSITGYFLIDSLIENRLKDAMISNFTLFERYYRGNRYNAEQIVKLHNKRLSQNFAKKILDNLNKIEPKN